MAKAIFCRDCKGPLPLSLLRFEVRRAVGRRRRVVAAYCRLCFNKRFGDEDDRGGSDRGAVAAGERRGARV